MILITLCNNSNFWIKKIYQFLYQYLTNSRKQNKKKKSIKTKMDGQRVKTLVFGFTCFVFYFWKSLANVVCYTPNEEYKFKYGKTNFTFTCYRVKWQEFMSESRNCIPHSKIFCQWIKHIKFVFIVKKKHMVFTFTHTSYFTHTFFTYILFICK